MDNYEWEDPKIGYVIEIPNTHSIIVNVGLDDDIQIGNKLVVYEEGPEIIDTQTKEKLGRKDFVKDILEVTELYDRFSICQKITKKSINKLTYSMAALLSEKEYIEYEELNVNETQVKEWKIKNATIEIDDPIKKL